MKRRPYCITKETLKGTDILLVSFYFNNGANVYALACEKEGNIRHTLVDSGDPHYRTEILAILAEEGINPANIERIIITHSHSDHFGLAHLLARKSNARIFVRESFRDVIEQSIRSNKRNSLNDFDPARLKDCDIEYLPTPGEKEDRMISGIAFSRLMEPVKLGEIGTLEILAPPESKTTHSDDQVLVLYSPTTTDPDSIKHQNNWLPTDFILFSGDLLLMRGPVRKWDLNMLPRRLDFYYHRVIKPLLKGAKLNLDHRKQDPQAKDALKTGFSIIRVKPGHGEEFLGTRIIPNGLLAQRDLLVKLGYTEDSSKAILRQKELAEEIVELKEQAYRSFVSELIHWLEVGYNISEISALVKRIYNEQSGGKRVVRADRQQRRVLLKETLARLEEDENQSDELRQMASATLSELVKIQSLNGS